MLTIISIPALILRLISTMYAGSALHEAPFSTQPSSVTVISEKPRAAFLVDSFSIHNQLLHEELNNVLKVLLATREGKIAAITDTFSSRHTNWVWKIQEGALPKNVVAQSRLDGDAVLTIFDYEKLRHATDLFVASNILHELMHAYLTLYYRCDPFRARKDYPKIQVAWQRRHTFWNTFNYNDIQHQEIEEKFTEDIAAVLKAYSKQVNLVVENIVFSDLAWGGLNFRNSDSLTYEEKERIHNRLLAEMLNLRVGNEQPAGVAITARR